MNLETPNEPSGTTPPLRIHLTPTQQAEADAHRAKEDKAAFLARHPEWNKPLAPDFDGEHSAALEDAKERLAMAAVGALNRARREPNAAVYGAAKDLGESFQVLEPAADDVVRQKQIISMERAYQSAAHADLIQHIKAHPELSYLLTEGDLKHFSGIKANLKRFAFAWQRGMLSNELAELRNKQADGKYLDADQRIRMRELSEKLANHGDSSDGSFMAYSATTMGEMLPFMGSVMSTTVEGTVAGALAGTAIEPGGGTAVGALSGLERSAAINFARVANYFSRARSAKIGGTLATIHGSEQLETGMSMDRYIQEFTAGHGRAPNETEIAELGRSANISGHLKGALEVLPLHSALHFAGGAGQRLIQRLGIKSPLAVAALGGAAAVTGQTIVEGGEEMAQQAGELAFSPTAHSGAQWLDEILDAGKGGATAGLWLGLLPALFSGARSYHGQKDANSAAELEGAITDQAKIDAAHAGAATLQSIHQQVKASDLAKLGDKTAFQTLATEITKDSPITEITLDSASLAKVIAVEQQGVKDSLQKQFPDLADQIASRAAITMSLADYIAHIAPLDKSDELLPGAHLDQSGFSLEQAQQREAELKTNMPAILKAAQDAEKNAGSLSESAQKVREEVQAIATAQGVDDEQAMLWGYLYGNFFATQGRRSGQDPHELFKSYGWNLKTAGTAAESRDKVSPETPDAAASQTQNATAAALAYASAAESSQSSGMGEVREGESVDANRAPSPLSGDHPAARAELGSPQPEQLTLSLPGEPQPVFYDEVGMSKIGSWDAGIKEIHSHADLARASSAIAADPQENVLAVATDKKGKILAVHSVTRGTLDRSTLHPREIVTWLAAYPKAAQLWLSHNHPGGDSSLSPQDLKTSEALDDILRDTHIRYHGLIAVANNGSGIRWTAPDFTTGTATPVLGKHLVPHVKRSFIKQTGQGMMMTSPDQIIRMMKAENREDESALLLVNTRNRLVGIFPYDIASATHLRGTERLKTLLTGLHRGSPARFMAYDGSGKAELKAFRNLSAFGRQMGIEMLDAITRDHPGSAPVSMREGNSSKGLWDIVENQSEYNQSAIGEDAPEKRIGQRTPSNFTPEEQVAWETELTRRDDKAEVLRQLKHHAGTPWAKQAIEGVFTRAAARLLLEGKTPDFQSALESNSVKSLRKALEKGTEEFWWSISVKNGLLSEAAKPVNNVSSTFLNCRPSDDCAQYCYATKGNYIFSGSMVKSELVSLAVEMDPTRAAKAVADEYKRTFEFKEMKALRLFDKGDISAEWLPFIAELEKQGVRTHIFSKRPELLRQVSSYHVRLLSIDQSNGVLAEQNPDLPVAYVYTERSQLEEIAKLVKRGQMQVILPVKVGSRVLHEDEVKPIRAIPGASKYLCPIDTGVKKLGDGRNNTWNCTKCDKAGGVGCYVGQSTERIENYNENKELDEDASLIQRIITTRSRLQSAGRSGVSTPDGHLPEGASTSTGRVSERVDAGLDFEMDSLLGELLARLGRSKTAGIAASREGRTLYQDGADARNDPQVWTAELEPSRSAAEEGELFQDRTESYRDRDWNVPEEGDLDQVITRKSVDAAEAAILATPDPQVAAAKLLFDYLKIRHYIRPNNKLAEANAFLLRVGTKYHDPAGLMLAIGATEHPELHPDVIRSFVSKIDRQLKASAAAKAMAPQAAPVTRTAPPRASFTPATNLITLFKTADRSSFLHESGHFFLEVIRDLAHRDGASPDLVADWALIEQQFGNADGIIDKPGHELFARSFEGYLMRGEAPSPELRPLFAQFRDWLLAVYHSLTGLNHRASPEVKSLFDRMLASDEAVAATLSHQVKSQLSPELAKKLGINEAEWQDYLKAAATAKDEAVKAIDQVYWRPVMDAMNAHADKVRATRAEVEAAIKAKPAWRAIDALRKGSQHQRLNTEALIRRFGETLIKKLPRFVPPLHSAEGELFADDFAQEHGYADAGDLIQDLAGFAPLEEQIRAGVDARLRGEDDPMEIARSEGARAVNQALRKGKIGEAGAAVIARELVILSGKGKPWQHIERARAAARQLMLSSPAKKILAPAIYARAAEREAATAARLLTEVGTKQAAEAGAGMASGSQRRTVEAAGTILSIDDNRAKAAAAKERQLMQFMLAREAEKARDERNSIYERLLDPVGKEVHAEYKAMIEEIRRAIHIYQNPDNQRPELIAFLLREKKAENGAWITPIPDAVLDAFADAETGINHHQAMSLVELDEYAATIEALKITGTRKALADSEAAKKAEAARIKLLVEDIGGAQAAPPSGLIQQNPRSLGDFLRSDAKVADTQAWSNVQGFAAAFLRYEQIIAVLDNSGLAQRIGQATKQLWKPIDQAQHTENDLILEANKELLKAIDAMPKEQRVSMDDIITVPEVGRQFKRSEILMVLLNLGNRGNAEKLTIGYNWSGAQLEAIVSHLSPEDARLAQQIWNDIGKWWPKVNELQLRTTGHGIGKVKPQRLRLHLTERSGAPVEVELEGGYFPVIYDPNADKSGRISNFDEMAALRMFQGGSLRAETNQSFTKARTKAAYPILLELGALRRHITNVAHDLSHREAIALVMRTLQHAEVRSSIEKRVGRGAFLQLQPAIEAIAKGSEIDKGQQKANAVLRHVRSGVTYMGLGWRFSTAIVQTLGYGNAIEVIGPAAMAKGIAASFNTPEGFESARAAMFAKSGEMRHRHNNLDRDLADSIKTLGNDLSKVDKFRQWSFWMINEMDRAVTTPTWWGAYLDHLQQHPTQEDEAIALADRAVRLSQGAGGTKDVAGWQRGSELQKLFTMFYTPMNAVFNRLWAHSRAFRTAWQQDRGSAMRMIPNLMMRYFLLSLLPGVLLAAIRGKLPEDDESWLEWLAKNNLLYLAGVLPFVRDIIPTIAGKGTGQMTPASQAIGAVTAVGHHAFDDEDDWGNPEAWLDSVDMIGYAFRLPMDQLTTIVHNLIEAGGMGSDPLGVKDLMRRR